MTHTSSVLHKIRNPIAAVSPHATTPAQTEKSPLSKTLTRPNSTLKDTYSPNNPSLISPDPLDLTAQKTLISLTASSRSLDLTSSIVQKGVSSLVPRSHSRLETLAALTRNALIAISPLANSYSHLSRSYSHLSA